MLKSEEKEAQIKQRDGGEGGGGGEL